MEITQQQARTLLQWFHVLAHETNPEASDFALAIELAKEAKCPAKYIAELEKGQLEAEF
jgi:hypothetical protein